MNIGFTGTQNGLTLSQRISLRNLLQRLGPVEFHHGDCIGADASAHAMLAPTKCRIIIHPSTNEKKRAHCNGPNARILPAKPPLQRNPDIFALANLLIACPKNDFEEVRSGTWATARGAVEKKVPVTVVWPDGRVQEDWQPAD